MAVERETIRRQIRAYQITRRVIKDPGGREELRRMIGQLRVRLAEAEMSSARR